MQFKNRLIKGLIATFIAIGGGTAGYKLLGGPEWSLLDAIYMTIITLTTVGFGEIQDLSTNPYARILTIFIIFFGMGSLLFVVSTVTGLLEKLNTMEKILFINDDATNDEALVNAGVHQAQGLITILPDDKDNLFVTLTAKQLNPNLRIVSKGLNEHTIKKLKMAGADSVVLSNAIGGLRMVSELIRPVVVSFLDKMLRSQKGKSYRIEEVTIPANSKFIGQTLTEANLLHNTRLLLVAMKGKEGDFVYNPESSSIIKDDSVIVVMGESLETNKVREWVENQ